MTSTTHFFDQPEDGAAWDSLVTAYGGHVLQSWAWGELKARFGWQVHRLRQGPAAAQILYRTLPGGLGTLGYVPKGPMVDPALAPDNYEALHGLLEAIGPLSRRMQAICLKIEPDESDDPGYRESLKSLGFLPSPQPVQPRRTIVVDVEEEPEQLLARMKPKTRYNIRLAGRKGVTVRAGDEQDLPGFYQLMETTAKRDGFCIHTQAYYEAAHSLFVPSGQGCLLLAEHDGELLAGLVALAMGETACYMYGASSSEGRELMPTYALQWEAMHWAKEKGCRTYDLWGVPDEDESRLEAEFPTRGDGLWGVYRFKRGFGGTLVRSTGAWDLVYAPLRYRLYKAAVSWLARGQAD